MLTNVLLPASYCPRDLIPRICHTGETAINRGLAKRLEQMAKERERRERAAAAADEEFSAEFLTAARKVFQMIDDDDSGTLEKAEIVTAVRANKVANAASYNLQSVICGTAVFVRLVCGGAGSSNDRFTLRRRLSSSSPTAATRTSSTCWSRRASRPPSRRWTRTTTAPSTRTSGAFRSLQLCAAFDAAMACLWRRSTSPAHRSMFRAGRSASRRRSRTSSSSAPRPARRRARPH